MKTQKTPIFQGIGETALAEMFTCGGARCKTYAKGEVLLRAGCITREVGIVQAGGVNIENIDLWGNRSILSYVPAGQVFAETYAFCGEPMMVDVVAAEETEVLFLNMDVLIHTPHPDSEWQPVLVQNLLNISLHKNLALSERIFCTAPKTVRGRLLLYLSNQAAKAGSKSFRIPFDRQGLASTSTAAPSRKSWAKCGMREYWKQQKTNLPCMSCRNEESFFSSHSPFPPHTSVGRGNAM